MHRLLPDRLLQLGFGFQAAKTLLCAVELGLFTELGRGPRTARQLRRALALNERATPDLLDALVAMGVLDRDGDDVQAVYLNTREASQFLDRRSPAYIGAVLKHANAHLYGLWGQLGTALKDGPARAQGVPLRPPGATPEEPFASEFEALSEHFDFSVRRSLVFIDAGGEQLAGVLAPNHPQLRCQYADPMGSMPAADVVVIVGGLRGRSLEGKLALLVRARAALREGGCLIVIDRLIDDGRRRCVAALLASLNARLELGDAFGFSGADLNTWCLETGFGRTEVIALGETVSAAIACK